MKSALIETLKDIGIAILIVSAVGLLMGLVVLPVYLFDNFLRYSGIGIIFIGVIYLLYQKNKKRIENENI